MRKTIVMPQLGSTMDGTVSTFLKRSGDRIENDEIILAMVSKKIDLDMGATVRRVITEP